MSLRVQHVPSLWKDAVVVPVPKQTDLTVCMWISDTHFFLIDVHINVKRSNISLLLIDHAAQCITGRISGQSVLIHQHSFTDDPKPNPNPG